MRPRGDEAGDPEPKTFAVRRQRARWQNGGCVGQPDKHSPKYDLDPQLYLALSREDTKRSFKAR
jgi:hypothetical protein